MELVIKNNISSFIMELLVLVATNRKFNILGFNMLQIQLFANSTF